MTGGDQRPFLPSSSYTHQRSDVDEQALIRALKSGQISGAGLDMIEKEPPNKNAPPGRIRRGFGGD